MNKILRFSFISLLMMLCGSIYADETTIWSEDWQSAEKDTKVEDVSNANATYKGDNGAYVKLYANANDATNMELLVPKSSRGVNFQADVKLDGETSMTLTFDINNNVDVTSTTSGAELTKVSNTEYTITVPSGTTILNLTFTMALDKNGRLDNIKLVSGSNEGGGGDTPVTPDPDPDPQPSTDGITFDFDADANTLFGIEGSSSGSGATYVADGEFNEDKTATIDGVSVTVTASDAEVSTRNRIWATAPKLRLYNGTLTVTAPADQNISKISFEGLSWNSSKKAMNFNATPSVGNLEVSTESSDKTATWTGTAASVVFTIGSNLESTSSI